MIKPDEKELLKTLQERSTLASPAHVRLIVGFLGMNEKRAAYILGKWSDKGWYDYGVSVMAGWLTQEGRNVQL